jgi:hypothetical protein
VTRPHYLLPNIGITPISGMDKPFSRRSSLRKIGQIVGLNLSPADIFLTIPGASTGAKKEARKSKTALCPPMLR